MKELVVVTGGFGEKKMKETIFKTRWASKDIQILEKLWFKTPRIEIKSNLPNRTWRSISTKANRMGFKRESIGKNINGTFKQKHGLFSLDNFNDGYIDSKGRFRVWCPDHPRAYNEGYILRAIVAYEAYYGVKVTPDMDIHHKNGNKLDDSKNNLEMMSHGEHTMLHNINPNLYIKRICENCKKEFEIEWYKLHDLSGGAKRRGVYCCQKCFHESRRMK